MQRQFSGLSSHPRITVASLVEFDINLGDSFPGERVKATDFKGLYNEWANQVSG
jgi:hypothetical protein